MKDSALLVAGFIFLLAALLHLLRLYNHFPLIVGSTLVPYWINWVGFAVSGLLSGWMFYARQQRE